MPVRAFPWDEAMSFALAVLRLSPASFWAMSPRELAVAMGAYSRIGEAPGRSRLESLMRAFPDTGKNEEAI